MHISISASNGDEYQEYFLGGKDGRCVGLTNLPTSCADCLEIWEPQLPGTLTACPGRFRACFTLLFTLVFRRDREEVTENWRKLHDTKIN